MKMKVRVTITNDRLPALRREMRKLGQRGLPADDPDGAEEPAAGPAAGVENPPEASGEVVR
jgi:hypothetical protein